MTLSSQYAFFNYHCIRFAERNIEMHYERIRKERENIRNLRRVAPRSPKVKSILMSKRVGDEITPAEAIKWWKEHGVFVSKDEKVAAAVAAQTLDRSKHFERVRYGVYKIVEVVA